MKQVLLSGVLALMLVGGPAQAKLPPPDDAAKAKAAEAAAKAAWQGKVDAYQLCKAQDRVAAFYKKTAGSAPSKPATPATAAPPAPCIEPGPFAYNPPEQKALEPSGAHSPTGTAASPLSVKDNSSQMVPAKKP